MSETIEIHESPQCKVAMQSQTKVGEIPPYQRCPKKIIVDINGEKKHILLSKIILLCEECDKPIFNAKSLNKRFCEDCLKTHRYSSVKIWKATHPNKTKEYQRLKYIRKVLRNGKEPNVLICNCQLCGKDISNRNSKAKYCKECSNEIRYYRAWYQAEVIQSRNIVKKSLIIRCVRCGKNISMLSGKAMYCHSCKENWEHLYELGSTTISSFMKRKISGLPDFQSELRNIERHMRSIGLKPCNDR